MSTGHASRIENERAELNLSARSCRGAATARRTGDGYFLRHFSRCVTRRPHRARDAACHPTTPRRTPCCAMAARPLNVGHSHVGAALREVGCRRLERTRCPRRHECTPLCSGGASPWGAAPPGTPANHRSVWLVAAQATAARPSKELRPPSVTPPSLGYTHVFRIRSRILSSLGRNRRSIAWACLTRMPTMGGMLEHLGMLFGSGDL